MVKQKDSTFSLLFSLKQILRTRAEVPGMLPMAQLEALRYINEAKEPTMQDIARHQCTSAPSATALIEELAEAGCLTRLRDARDRRQVRLALTPHGTTVLRRSMTARRAVVEAVFGTLDAHERAELNRLLKRIIDNHVY